MHSDGGRGSGNFGHKGRPGKVGGSAPSGTGMRLTGKEIAKVTHDINNVWHARFKGIKYCTIVTRSNEINSPMYRYDFTNHGFNNYTITYKGSTKKM